MDDLRYAFRQFRIHPGFALTAVATLALGIGAAAAMFGLVQGVLLSPPPYADPERLVLVTPARVDGQPYQRGTTIGQWIAWRGARSVEPPAMYRWTFNFLVREEGSRSLGGLVVTRDFFDVIGVRPALGRTFSEEEAAGPNSAPAAVIISHDLWQREFGGNRDVIGRTVRISRMPPLPVVGVMPPGLRFLPDPGAAAEPNYDVDAKVDFWLGMRVDESRRDRRAGNTLARLRPGFTVEQAQAELAAMSASLATADTTLAGLTARVERVRSVLNRDGERLLVPLFGAVTLLFVIACANVTGLLLARGLRRQAEYATRTALGASRTRLFRLVLTESFALTVAGALAGLAVAAGLIALVHRIGGRAVPRLDSVEVGWPVLAFGAGAAILATGLAGLVPALRASGASRPGSGDGTRTTAGRTERRWLAAVATVQIVLTVSLLAGAALLVRTATNLDRVQPGYASSQILAMTVTSVERERWRQFHTQALERIAALPGVSHAAFAWGVPLTGNKWPADVELPGRDASAPVAERVSVPVRAVTPAYFDVMGIALVDGRGFNADDGPDAGRVAIVNTAFVERHLGGGAPLGRPIRLAFDDRAFTIVGVLANTRTERLDQAPEPELYVSLWQSPAFSKHLVVRTTGDPVALAARVREALREVEPTAAVERVTTMAAIREGSTAVRTFALRLLTGFALAATLLAAVGLYGVLALSIGARTKELAVRKAMGAQVHQLVGLVLGEGARLAAVGVAVGIGGALLVGRLVQSLLFDVAPGDPLSISAAATAFALVALAACLGPAWRAGRVDLMESLRQE